MSGELVPRSDVDSWVDVIGPVGDLAGKIARTEFVPRALQGNPAGVAAAILTGREMGLGPMAALRGIHIVEGRPSLSAEMLAARILSAGHLIQWKTSTDKTCTVRIERADGRSEAEVTWSMADAQRAGLAGKQVWQRYPRHMLRWRALTEAADMCCPDVAMGLDVIGGPILPATAAPEQAPAAGAAVIQVTMPEPEPEPEPIVDAVIVEEPEPAYGGLVAEELATPRQIARLNTMLTLWAKAEGIPLDRPGRRKFAAFLAGIPDPESLASAKDLTAEQAGTAIQKLTEYFREREAAEKNQAEPPPGEPMTPPEA